MNIMSNTEFVRWNRIPLSLPTGNVWGVSIAPKVSFSSDSFSCLNEARFILNVTLTQTGGTGLQTTAVSRPSLAWINNANLNLTYLTDGGEKTVVYNSIAGRGDAGFILEVCDLSAAQYTNVKGIEYLNDSTGASVNVTINKTTFDVVIPLRYLFSPAAHKRYLPLMDATFNLTFRQLLEIFNFPTGIVNPGATLNSMYLHFPSYKFATIPRALTMPPNEDVFIQVHDMPIGTQSLSGQLNVPGRPKKILYVMGKSVASTGAGNAGVYSLVANPLCMVRSHSFKLGGSIYPLDQDYNTKYSSDALTEQGTGAFYHEFQVITNNFSQDKNSFNSYDNWVSKYRIYAIDTNESTNRDTTFTFNIQFITTTTEAARLFFVVLYEPTIQPTMDNTLRIS